MKKSTRRFVSLVLVACLVMAFAMTVSAASHTYNGTYKNQGYQAKATYSSSELYASLGTASTYSIYVTIIYKKTNYSSGTTSPWSYSSSTVETKFAQNQVNFTYPYAAVEYQFTYHMDGTTVHTHTP